MLQRLETLLPSFSSQALANAAWAFARLALRDVLLSQIAWRTAAAVHDASAQDLANSIWAFAKSQLRHHPAEEAIALVCTSRAHEFSAQQLSNSG